MSIANDDWIQTRHGESAEDALTRRVKMHEFLLTGGVQIGVNEHGHMEYTSEIDPVEYGPACPWHGEGCTAWIVVYEGDSDGSGRVGPAGLTLAELREKFPHIARADRRDAKADSADPDPEAATKPTPVQNKIDASSQYAPNSVAFGDNNEFVGATALCAKHWSRNLAEALAKDAGLGDDPLWGKAPKSRYQCVVCVDLGEGFGTEEPEVQSRSGFGNPWDRQPGTTSGGYQYSPETGGKQGFGSRFGKRRPRLEDSRDTAVRAFDAVEEPDVIEIDGDEDE